MWLYQKRNKANSLQRSRFESSNIIQMHSSPCMYSIRYRVHTQHNYSCKKVRKVRRYPYKASHSEQLFFSIFTLHCIYYKSFLYHLNINFQIFKNVFLFFKSYPDYQRLYVQANCYFCANLCHLIELGRFLTCYNKWTLKLN